MNTVESILFVFFKFTKTLFSIRVSHNMTSLCMIFWSAKAIQTYYACNLLLAGLLLRSCVRSRLLQRGSCCFLLSDAIDFRLCRDGLCGLGRHMGLHVGSTLLRCMLKGSKTGILFVTTFGQMRTWLEGLCSIVGGGGLRCCLILEVIFRQSTGVSFRKIEVLRKGSGKRWSFKQEMIWTYIVCICFQQSAVE